MATGHAFMAMSLDGFVARPDHRLDWLMKQPTAGEDHGYDRFIGGVDGLIMGSGSFRTALGFDAWPYEKPVLVLSRSLTESDLPEPLRAKVRIAALDPATALDDVAARGGGGPMWMAVGSSRASCVRA